MICMSRPIPLIGFLINGPQIIPVGNIKDKIESYPDFKINDEILGTLANPLLLTFLLNFHYRFCSRYRVFGPTSANGD